MMENPDNLARKSTFFPFCLENFINSGGENKEEVDGGGRGGG